jgi:hypothetical protein
MTLPAHALNVLITFKKELLSRDAEPTKPTKPGSDGFDGAASDKFPIKEPVIPKGHRSHVARPARRPNGYQRACQRHDFFTPVY